MNRIRTFIVDDHYMVIEGIRSLLQNDPDIILIGHAFTASSCLAFLEKEHPDVILMDIGLPDRSGVDLCAEVKQKYPFIRIIGLSTFNQHSFIEKMMESGASGYVLKNASGQELSNAIKKVHAGQVYLSFEASMVVKSHQNSLAQLPMLTRREKEILTLISEGYTNPRIAEKLFVSINTVDTHRKNLLAKFNVSNTATLIRMAVESGLISPAKNE
jgi:DNA-binding NarL/FixJ family response regulator